MENVLQGLTGVCAYLDDILVSGKTPEDHMQNLEAVLERLEQAGLRLKRAKCLFMLPSVEYLGFQISAKGLQPTSEKVRAVQNAPAPTDVSQLKSFVGLVNYYGKFLPDLSHVLAPLYRLLQKSAKWVWEEQQQKAFKEVKSMLTSDCLLAHFDPTEDLILACDASPYGVGAVLSHRYSDGQERPIAFASRSLGAAEKKYSQLEKEGLAIVFGVKKFHMYLFGRHFEIVSDHKPLQHLFHHTRATPTMASARIQRWALTLGGYDYSISYKPGDKHGNADLFSRLPLGDTPKTVPDAPETILLMSSLESTPITAAKIKQWTRRDPVVSKIADCVLHGWSNASDQKYRPYQQRREELSVHDGCLLWGNRVVIPPAGRQQAMDLFHEGHPGASRMKSLARAYIWWPGMDSDLEHYVNECDVCQTIRNNPPQAPLLPWEYPQRPWVRVQADFAGPYEGKMFFILIDSYSKWLEVVPMTTATSTTTIECLRSIFATHGLPEVFVSDNGTQFTSAEFKTFMERNCIRHLHSAPYHPATNGLAERAVQLFKRSMEKNTEGTIATRVARFLFAYRRTPHTTTGVTPAELLLGRIPRSHLDLLKPAISNRVQNKQQSQKEQHDAHAKQRGFQVGDPVFVRDFPGGKRWISGSISSIEGPRSCHVALCDGRTVRRHIDHIRFRSSAAIPDNSSGSDDLVDYPSTPAMDTVDPPVDPAPVPPILRRSTRVSVPPDRYGH